MFLIFFDKQFFFFLTLYFYCAKKNALDISEKVAVVPVHQGFMGGVVQHRVIVL